MLRQRDSARPSLPIAASSSQALSRSGGEALDLVVDIRVGITSVWQVDECSPIRNNTEPDLCSAGFAHGLSGPDEFGPISL